LIFKKLGSFGIAFFVGYIIIVAGLGLFGPFHLALNLNGKRELRSSFFNRQKSASLEPLSGFLRFVVSKLQTKHKIKN